MAVRSQLLVLRRALSRAVPSTRKHVPAFVFDIDGVLVRGGQVLEGGRRALELLHDSASRRPRLPTVFLTNGGGHSEAERARRLNQLFDISVHESQVVLSHTPMRALAEDFNAAPDDALVACVGRRHCADVARDVYGIRRAVPIEDMGRSDPVSTPMVQYHPLQNASAAPVDGKPVSAILVMHDSWDWGRDIQLCCDLLTSDGSAERKPVDHQVVPIWFSNPDFVFPNEHALPRFGQGAFKTALKAVYQELTGKPLRYKTFGKPHSVQYRHCEQVIDTQLQHFNEDILVDRIYAIGDNPAADIRGANAAGSQWISVLVRTGCFRGSNNDAKDPADYVVEDAAEVVELVLKSHEML